MLKFEHKGSLAFTWEPETGIAEKGYLEAYDPWIYDYEGVVSIKCRSWCVIVRSHVFSFIRQSGCFFETLVVSILNALKALPDSPLLYICSPLNDPQHRSR